MPALAHSTTVTFGGTVLGDLVQVTASPGTAVFHDVTGLHAGVAGAGFTARVYKSLDCVAVEPGTVSVRLLGTPSGVSFSTGHWDYLSVSTPDGGVSGWAALTSWEIEAAVGDLIRVSATFQFL